MEILKLSFTSVGHSGSSDWQPQDAQHSWVKTLSNVDQSRAQRHLFFWQTVPELQKESWDLNTIFCKITTNEAKSELYSAKFSICCDEDLDVPSHAGLWNR